MKLKGIVAVFAGVVVSFLLIYLFTYIEVRFGSGSVVRYCLQTQACSEEQFYGAVQNGIFRSSYIYNPIIVALVSFGICLFSKGKLTYFLILGALMPMIVFHAAVGSFTTETVAQAITYGVLALVCALLIQLLVRRRSTKSSI